MKMELAMQTAATSPTPDRIEAFGAELDALRRRIQDDLGQRDVDHIRAVIRTANVSEAAGRVLLHFGLGPVTFVAGVAALATAKILENMEIGHNVMHGQYDWTGDPALAGRAYEWDTVSTGDGWRHSHNYEHHTFTNVLGKDRDVGYGLLRMSEEQRWSARCLLQPAYAVGLALAFEWGVALHDLRLEDYLRGRRPLSELRRRARPMLGKAGWQLFKDYGLFPALALWNAPRVLAGNLLANVTRNVWAFAIIFCGHFPDGVQVYRPETLEGETRGRWYLRQLRGSANFEGGRVFHVLSGHLSHQIEHHLFPDLPGARYPEIAAEVRAICERYGVPYNTGSFRAQFASVVARIVRLSLPSRAGAVAV